MVRTIGFRRDIHSLLGYDALRQLMRAGRSDAWWFHRKPDGALVYHGDTPKGSEVPREPVCYRVIVLDPSKPLLQAEARCTCPAWRSGHARFGAWCKHIWVVYLCSTTESQAQECAAVLRLLLEAEKKAKEEVCK